MDKNKSIILWGSLLLLFLIMIFIEQDGEPSVNQATSYEEEIYLSYNPEPIILDEPAKEPLPAPDFEPVAIEPVIELVPDLGRLAVTSVMMNKKTPQTVSDVAANDAQIELAHQQDDLAYKILQGQRFNAVLTHAIHSDLPGMVVAEVSQNIYGYQSYIPLIPVGTRLVGSYENRLSIGDTRLYITWQRAITPSGIDIQLDSISTDRLGQSGLTGNINTHFWQTFGTSSLLSVMAIGASNLSEEQGEYSNQYQQGVTEAMMDTSNTILQGRLKRKPTVHIPQGAIIHVMVAKDLDFSPVLKKTQQIPIF